MNREVISFYKNFGYQPSEIVKRGVDRFGLTVHGIEDAMVKLYNDVNTNGHSVPHNEIVWRVWDMAKDFDRESYETTAEERYRVVKELRNLKITLAFYRGVGTAAILFGVAYLIKEYLI